MSGAIGVTPSPSDALVVIPSDMPIALRACVKAHLRGYGYLVDGFPASVEFCPRVAVLPVVDLCKPCANVLFRSSR